MASKRLDRSCAGREGVRDRGVPLLGDTERDGLRGDVLALLLSGTLDVEARLDLVGVGEAALGGG